MNVTRFAALTFRVCVGGGATQELTVSAYWRRLAVHVRFILRQMGRYQAASSEDQGTASHFARLQFDSSYPRHDEQGVILLCCLGDGTWSSPRSTVTWHHSMDKYLHGSFYFVGSNRGKMLGLLFQVGLKLESVVGGLGLDDDHPNMVVLSFVWSWNPEVISVPSDIYTVS